LRFICDSSKAMIEIYVFFIYIATLLFPYIIYSKVLLSLWVQYFKGEESVGERSTCIVTGFAYLLIAMMILIVDETKLEIGLEKAYTSFNHSASQFLDTQGLSST